MESSLPSPPRCRRARRSPAAPPPPLLLPLLPPAVAAAAAELGRLEAACRKGCCDSATSPNQNDQKRDGEPWFYHHQASVHNPRRPDVAVCLTAHSEVIRRA